MHDQQAPRLPKWPFLLGDALLLGCAFFVYSQSKLPMPVGAMSLAAACVTAGALFAIVPFLLEYRAAMKLAEAAGLTTVVAQIQSLEQIARQISSAAELWQDGGE